MSNSQSYQKSFGQIVRNARLKHGFSQEVLAHEAKLTVFTINQIENGNTNPMLTTICKIAKALDTTVGELMQDL